MKIKVISIKSDKDKNPSVNLIGPDQELSAFKLLPEGKVPEMTLLHYGQQHYNLIMSKHSDIVKKETLSQQLENPVDAINPDEKEDHKDEDLDVSAKTSDEEEMSLQKKYKALEKDYKESQNLINILKKKIIFLEQKRTSKKKLQSSFSMEEEEGKILEEEIVSNKNSGFSRESPQFEPKANKTTQEVKCTKCESIFGSQLLLTTHTDKHHGRDIYECKVCASTFASKNQLEVHIKTKHKRAEGQQ